MSHPSSGDDGPRSLLKKLLAQSSIYGAGNFLIKAGNIVLLPVYWHFLSSSDYGIIGITQIIASFLASVLPLGLQEGVARFYWEWSEEKRDYHCGNIWLISLSLSAILAFTLDRFGPFLFGSLFTQVPFQPYLRISLWVGLAQSLAQIPFYMLRIKEQARKFVIISVLSFISGSLLTVYEVVYRRSGVDGYLNAWLLNAMIWGFYWIIFMIRQTRLSFVHFSWQNFSVLTRYSLPILPAAISESLWDGVDRFFLEKYVSLSTLGLYNLGRQFGRAYSMFNSAAKTAWIPLTYQMAAQQPPAVAGKKINKTAVLYTALLAIIAVGSTIFIREFIFYFGKSSYQGVLPYALAFIVIYFIDVLGAALGRGMDLAKKTIYGSYISILIVGINIVGNMILVPKYGPWGAVLSVGLAIALRSSLSIWLGHFFFPRKFPKFRLLAIVLSSLFVYLLCNHLAMLPFQSSFLLLLTQLALFSLYAVLLMKWVLKRVV